MPPCCAIVRCSQSLRSALRLRWRPSTARGRRQITDAVTGKVKNQITKGQWVVRGVDRVEDKSRQIWFRAGGIHPGQDSYYVHYCRINFDGSGLVCLTDGDGTHSIDYSPDRRFLIDSYSRVDMAPVTELRRVADSKRVCLLEWADISALVKTGWKVPERFVSSGRCTTCRRR